jgi:diketogulonate reductase-like aldo/keto reductase
MDKLVVMGLVKHLGVSNFSAKEMMEAQEASSEKITANQIEYNLLVRNNGQYTDNMEAEILPYCQNNEMFVVAYRPLAGGELARVGIKTLDEISKKYGKTPAQVSLNWLISKKNVVSIPKASSEKHIEEILGALNWNLEKEDLRRLDELPSSGY